MKVVWLYGLSKEKWFSKERARIAKLVRAAHLAHKWGSLGGASSPAQGLQDLRVISIYSKSNKQIGELFKSTLDQINRWEDNLHSAL